MMPDVYTRCMSGIKPRRLKCANARRMNASSREGADNETHILPCELLLLLTLDERLDEAIRHLFSRVHSGLGAEHHGPVNCDEVVVQFSTLGAHGCRDPLKNFEEVDHVRPGTCCTAMISCAKFIGSRQRQSPVSRINSMPKRSASWTRGSVAFTVRLPKVRVSMLLGE